MLKATLLCLALATVGVARAEVPAPVKTAALAVLDRGDAALARYDSKAMLALLDSSFRFANARASDKPTTGEAARTSIVSGYDYARQVKLTVRRDDVALDGDPSGDVVWFIADYTITTTGPDGKKVEHPLRESGVLIKRGSDWRFALLHSSLPTLPPLPAKK